MITVSKVVEDLVKQSPFLEEGLAEGLINLSSLARQLKPRLEKKLYKRVQIGAIVMALKRFTDKNLSVNPGGGKLNQILKNLGDITVRSNLASFTFADSSAMAKKLAELMQKASQTPKSFLTITDGVFETSIFASANLGAEIEKIFAGETVKSKLNGLSSITIIIPEEASKVPGVYYSILKKLAFEGINFVDVVSSFTELTIILEQKDVDRAFSALKS